MRARVLAVLFATLLALAAAPAHAALTTHYDLVSLALEAEAVVLARRTGERRLTQYDTLYEHRVEEVYAGPLRPGDVVRLTYDGFSLTPAFGWPRTDAGPPVFSDEVVLFLVHTQEGYPFPEDAGPPPAWRLVSSGLRIFGDGLAYRFEQESNPGLLAPVPQRADPFDVMGDPRAGAQLDRPALIRAIQAAIARARDVRAAIAAKHTREGRRALLDAIGPAEDDDDAPVPVSAWAGFTWEDRVAAVGIEALASTGDDDAQLEAVARLRCNGVHVLRPLRPGQAPGWVDAAAAQGAPLRRRLAAFARLGVWGLPHQDSASAARLLALGDDPEPEVRAAAIALRMGVHPPPKELVEAVVARWPKESDAHVKLVLLEAADMMHVLDRLSAPGETDEPIVWAGRRKRVVDVEWRNPGSLRYELVHLVITARTAGRTVATVDLAANPLLRSGWSSSPRVGENAFLDFAPPLAPGVYDLTARVDLQDQRKRIVSRTFALRRLHSNTSLVAAPSSPDAGPSTPSFTIAAPPPAPPPRSCLCALPGGRRAGDAPGALAALACLGLAAGARRARRRRAAAPRAAAAVGLARRPFPPRPERAC